MAKGQGKERGKSKLCGQHALVCRTCGKSGHVASQCPSGRVSALDKGLFGEVEENGDQPCLEEDWTSGDWSEDWWSEDWWSDELVAAVYASDTWDDDWWWPTWDEGWSDALTSTSWIVGPAPVEKATSLAAPAAPEPKATSGDFGPCAFIKGRGQGHFEGPCENLWLGTCCSHTWKHVCWHFFLLGRWAVPPCHNVSLGCMLAGCVDFDDFSAPVPCVDSAVRLPSWELSPVVYHLPHQDEFGDEADVLHPKTLEDWGLGNLDTRFFDPYLAEHELVVASLLSIRKMKLGSCSILVRLQTAAHQTLRQNFPLLRLDERAKELRVSLARL